MTTWVASLPEPPVRWRTSIRHSVPCMSRRSNNALYSAMTAPLTWALTISQGGGDAALGDLVLAVEAFGVDAE